MYNITYTIKQVDNKAAENEPAKSFHVLPPYKEKMGEQRSTDL